MNIGLALVAGLLWLAPSPTQQEDAQAFGARVIPAIAYPADATGTLELEPTARIPDADGKVFVERHQGATTLKVELDDMKPARLFGGDYSTYVLWAISPAGITENLGELVLDGDHSKLESSTVLATFGILVTAEPHYLVTAPSRFVILQNAAEVHGFNKEVKTLVAHYFGYEGHYNFSRSTLADVQEAEGPVRTLANQAWTAVLLARRAEADKYAPTEFTEAETALERTVNAAATNDWQEVDKEARLTIRLAVAAEHIAQRHQRRTCP